MNDLAILLAVFRRALRDRAIVGVAGLALVAASFLVAGGELASLSRESSVGYSIMGISTLALIAPLVGLMIGLAQTILESRGDAWSFLVHRPVSRSTLFWGKAFAGIALYLTATVFPLAILTLWLAAGRLPIPFDWRLILPGVADILSGLVFYFVGLLIGMRDARWFGTRAAGIGIGIACSFAVAGVREFWQAAAICSVGVVIAAVAALGTFLSGGVYESQRRATRAAVAVTVGSGVMVLGILGVSAGMALLPPPTETLQSTIYALTGDGEIVRRIRDGVGDTIAVEDLDGRVIEKYKDRKTRAGLATGVLTAETLINVEWRPPAWSYRKLNGLFLLLDTQGWPYTEGWYYVHDLGLVAAYNNRTAKFLGWMGPDGFSAGEAKPRHRFNGPLQNHLSLQQSLLVFSDAVYRIDVRDRHIERIFTPSAGEAVLGAGSTVVSQDALIAWGEESRFDVIATTRRVVVQSRDGVVRLTATPDSSAVGYGTVAVYKALRAPQSGWSVWYYAQPSTRPEIEWMQLPVRVTEFDNVGKPLAHHSLKLEKPSRRLSDSAIAPWLVVPLIARVALIALPQPYFLDGATSMQLFLAWVLPLSTSLLSTITIFVLGRRYAIGRGRLWLWVVLGILLGFFALALMVALLEWPARGTCPSCRRERIVTNEQCEHCGATFPAPPLDGTEIFESVGIR